MHQFYIDLPLRQLSQQFYPEPEHGNIVNGFSVQPETDENSQK